jgi:hypothetical protein
MLGVEEDAMAEGTIFWRGRGRERSKEDRAELVAMLVTLDCPGRKQTGREVGNQGRY